MPALRPVTTGCALLLGVAGALLLHTPAALVRADESRFDVTFTGGHDTDPRDRGRPVVLIASALKVQPEVFREAFRGVTPSRNGPPTGEEARRNKDALMRVLAPHGISNARLDEVSNYYRYRPQAGELWKTRSAQAYAVVEQGQVVRIVVTDAGAGYSSPPRATIAGRNGPPLDVSVAYGADLATNGRVSAITIRGTAETPK